MQDETTSRRQAGQEGCTLFVDLTLAQLSELRRLARKHDVTASVYLRELVAQHLRGDR